MSKSFGIFYKVTDVVTFYHIIIENARILAKSNNF